MFTFLVLGFVLVALAIVLAAIGVHALLLGRMPGRWLQQQVRQPRFWGAGAILILISWNLRSPSLLVVGVGLIAIGHAVKSSR
ncbi:hypothetical protein PV332_16175 [Streptomyces scabiei]|uniref:hypothetical protein n=1 Tax=Streptomyces scabiei TaxID=1930 RepID=UPI0005A2EBA5|nr:MULTISPECIES: hypothetical protein [Streptomyces]MBP5904575.1 hypothetical protein [Streptomyces sp. LBUM 1488]MDW8478271.1 hypothetical protein [Streptomyces scabiei]MDX2565765.1 hypothetical protein [Streptomyces scabiei]MDX2576996.1 hypothetical protein [Streptomyces scabiei]MDX2630508.1 hypothetical protein [Streptomyces scabiei]